MAASNSDEEPKRCLCDVTEDMEHEIEIFLNAKLKEAVKELEYAVYDLIIQDLKLHEYSVIQGRRQNNMLLSMYRYINYLYDMKNRKGRCEYCAIADGEIIY